MSQTFASRPAKVPPPLPPRGLGLAALTALVVGSMIGSGIFALPSQMAGSAAPGPLLIGWVNLESTSSVRVRAMFRRSPC